jgi:uncharacterized protein (TIGR03067 family)
MIRTALLASLFLAAVCGTTAADDPKPGPLEGSWKATSIVKEAEPAEKGEATFSFTGNTVRVTVPSGGKDQPAPFTLEPKANPATIDITEKRPGAKDRVIKGIYKIEKDTLTICAALDEGERPKDFKPAKTNIVITLERVKK